MVSPGMVKGRVVMGLLFFPRGGSAYVARDLSGSETHAATFVAGTEVHDVDYTDARNVFRAGGSAIAAPLPMQPSYEDRVDTPDVVLSSVAPGLADHLSWVWEVPFAAVHAEGAGVLHLPHLTPQHDAVARRWPSVPVLAHLHGTELRLIGAIRARAAVAAALGTTLADMPELMADGRSYIGTLDGPQAELARSTRWDQWRHGEFWAAHLRGQAAAVDHLVAVSVPVRAAAIELLGVEPERISTIP